MLSAFIKWLIQSLYWLPKLSLRIAFNFFLKANSINFEPKHQQRWICRKCKIDSLNMLVLFVFQSYHELLINDWAVIVEILILYMITMFSLILLFMPYSWMFSIVPYIQHSLILNIFYENPYGEGAVHHWKIIELLLVSK